MLRPGRFYSLMLTLWMEWHLQEEGYVKARTQIMRKLTEVAATPRSLEADPAREEVADNPFPGLLRGGPAGTIRH